MIYYKISQSLNIGCVAARPFNVLMFTVVVIELFLFDTKLHNAAAAIIVLYPIPLLDIHIAILHHLSSYMLI